MRHSTITLTLDTYRHLMPGAEPEAIAKSTYVEGSAVAETVARFARLGAFSAL